jgi:uncharacterized protein
MFCGQKNKTLYFTSIRPHNPSNRMNRYQLAKLVSWADTLKTRKRLQKVVFLLQAKGCQLETEFTLLHYGPYSEELARLTDEMVRKGLLDEEVSENQKGQQYTYRLPTTVEKQLQKLESTPEGRGGESKLADYEKLAKDFLKKDLMTLEHASTIVYFKLQDYDWETALEKAIKFKGTDTVKRALPFAKKVLS